MTEATQYETTTPNANLHMARTLAVSVLSGLAIAAGTANTEAETPAAHAAGLSDCAPYFNTAKYRDHQYEVCTAYVANSAEVALQGFYKFGNNRAGYLADGARHHLETRYFAGPRQALERTVDSWPTTRSIFGNKVQEDVDVVSVSSNLKADRGLLQTRESWKVSNKGAVLYNEPRHTKNITMCRGRLPGHILHAWFVVRLDRSPNFNCVAFDRQHGIKP